MMRMDTSAVLVLDVGTSKVHANIIAVDDGQLIAGCDVAYELDSQREGFFEVPPEKIFQAMETACAGVLDCCRADLCALTFSWFGANMTVADSTGKPLRDLIISYDSRAGKEARYLRSVLSSSRSDNLIRGGMGADSNPAKILWIKNNEPEVWSAAERIITIQQFVCARLELGLPSDRTLGVTLQLHEPFDMSPMADVLGALEIDETLLLDTELRTDTIIGDLNSFGIVPLPERLPVILGGHDCILSQLGLGAGPYSAVLADSAGTFDLMGYQRCGYTEGALPACEEDTFAVMGGGPFGDAVVRAVAAFGGGASLTELLDHTVFDGLPYESDPFRQAVEEAAFGMRSWLLKLHESFGRTFDNIRIAGGSAKSDAWLQLKADVYGIPIERPVNLEASSVGAAILAAVRLGVYKNVTEAQKSMIRTKQVFSPRADVTERYAKSYEEYLKTL